MYLFLGALNKETRQYESPINASKSNKYVCPDCNRDVILKKGSVRKHHFAHYKDDDPCMYYTHPSESQIHKDAKLLLKSMLDNKNNFVIRRYCSDCKSEIFEHSFFYINDCELSAIIEYRFNYNNTPKIADVAHIQNNEIIYIFEIFYKHKTREEDRPEPWCEFDAVDLLQTHNSGIIKCIRKQLCRTCLKNKEEPIDDVFLSLYKKMRHEKDQRFREIQEDRETKKRYEELKVKYYNYNPIITRASLADKQEYYEYTLLKERYEACRILEE